MLYSASVLAITRISFVRAFRSEALLPAPVGASRFVIRATHERGVGVPPSRSLATASREAVPVYGDRLDPARTYVYRLRSCDILNSVNTGRLVLTSAECQVREVRERRCGYHALDGKT